MGGKDGGQSGQAGKECSGSGQYARQGLPESTRAAGCITLRDPRDLRVLRLHRTHNHPHRQGEPERVTEPAHDRKGFA